MANLSAQYPDLNKMFGEMSMLPSKLGMEQYDMARGNEQINQRGALQDIYQADQMNPLKVREQQIKNDTGLAQLPGFAADSSLRQDKATVSRNTLGDQEKAERSKLIASMSDDDVKSLYNDAKALAMSRNPQERLLGEELLKQHPEMVKERQTHAQKMREQAALEGQRGKNAIDLANVNNEAGRFQRGSKMVLTLDQAIDNSKSAKERHQKLLDAAVQAKQAGDKDAEANYRARAEAVRPQAQAEIANASVRPGGADIDALGMQTNKPQSIAPPQTQKPAAAQKLPPQPGEVRGGWKFNGGHPGDKNNWTKVQ